MGKILGIDLGTTNSAMAIVEAGSPKIIENKEGNRTTPSVVAQSKDNDRLAGIAAKRQSVANPKNTIYSAKRLIGRKFSDSEVKADNQHFPFEIREQKEGGTEIQMGEKWYRPAEISAMVLQKLKQDAEERLGEKIEDAVITVPAYFDDSQRKATKDAGTIAGFNVKRIINEPTAAALAYGFNKKKDEKIVVYDFGGGTFDVSVLEVSEDTIEVKATGGDTHLGGDDFDKKIIEWLISEFKKQEGIDLSNDTLAIQRLKDAAEKAKHELSSTAETEINIPFITSDANGPKHLAMKLTRALFEDMVSDYIKRAEDKARETIQDAGFQISDINEVVLVGGQTRMPALQESVRKLLNKEPHRDINPDEVVAMGAAIQGGILGGDVQDVLLLDVTPLSLGIETMGSVMTKLIEKNTTIPAQNSQVFSTAADNQPSVEINVLQGEREMSQDNKSLGKFVLDGIPPAPRGTPQIEVVFDLDANGILNVSAKDKATGKEQSVRIEASSDLSSEEVEKMRKDAEMHAEEDKKQRELIDIKNEAESFIYTTEKSLKEYGDKIDEDTKKSIEQEIKNLQEVRNGDDKEKIQAAITQLATVSQKLGEQVYKAEQEKAQSGKTEQKEDTVQDQDVKDADFEEKKDKEEGSGS
ncbi:MAG: molecular chaperone DnaK [Candidatus Spechtbacteria bacterium SB0662_bin_43]|uniref:Chaperone protein DnaK n=1 Tax=Candidatus Spechtbacteria bacterium SB0662_bin_43 TaxID=2604897 RepID=A0A845D922_9BACT|nr:molecular chaperone DnaK [Candidatus Spechtbacteria bacterium SB0662_bin_43]